MEAVNVRLEKFIQNSDQKLGAAQAACNAYVSSMKSISSDLQNILTRVKFASFLCFYIVEYLFL